MRSIWFLAACILGLIGAPFLTACKDESTAKNLIPRTALLGDPSRIQLRLSPDGKLMSFLAPDGGTLNIWVAPLGALHEARPITHDHHRGIHAHYWLANSDLILFEKELVANGGTHLYSVDPRTGIETDLTPGENIDARLVAWSWDHPNEILVGLNDRAPRFHDLYRLNLRSGLLALVEKNDRFSEIIADNDLNPRFALEASKDGISLYRRKQAGWAIERKVALEDAVTFELYGFDSTNRYLYILDSTGRNTTALKRVDTQTGLEEQLAASSQADISHLLIHPRTYEVQAFSVNLEKKRWAAISPEIETHLQNLIEFSNGAFQLVNRTPDDRTWVVYIDKITEPGGYYLYDTQSEEFEFQFSIKPELKGRPLVPMTPVIIQSRDGLELVGYLSLPTITDLDDDGRPTTPLPLVLNVHPGPWYRDSYEFNERHQWLANRGYAALSVNYRGSTGFGKAFLNAGDGEWGAQMQNDLVDAVDWAVDSKIAIPEKVAIMGGSYGGYAALAGLTLTPEKFACGISISGPSNLITYLETVPPHWVPMKTLLSGRVGDPNTREGQAVLEARSPLFKASDIVRPLLISQGGLDESIKQAEIEQMISSISDRGVPYVYLLYPDEGHGIKRAQNAVSFYAIAEAFLARCLGGRSEPVGNALLGANMEIRQGENYIPELRSLARSH